MKMYTCPKHYFILLQFNIRQKLLGWRVQKGVGGQLKYHLKITNPTSVVPTC